METIGFIGVGAMGGPIARRMAQNGVPLLVFDKSPDACARMRAAGATIAGSVREVADRCEIVFTSLPAPEISRAVATGPDGFAGAKAIKIHVELSTTGGAFVVELADALAKKGITLIDCPVVGGKVSVEAGTLGVLPCGPKPAFERVKPVLERFAGRIFYLGEKAGMGQAAKVMNNSLTLTSILASCEAIAMGMKAGLDMDTALAIINQGSGSNFLTMRVFPDTIAKGDFGGTGAMHISVKDFHLFLDEARRVGMETPVASVLTEIQERVAKTGPLDRDSMTTFHYFSDLAGLPRQG